MLSDRIDVTVRHDFRRETGRHAELCVRQRLGEEGAQRGYYRHRSFHFFSKGESYACSCADEALSSMLERASLP
jgi:hypothetical protein